MVKCKVIAFSPFNWANFLHAKTSFIHYNLNVNYSSQMIQLTSVDYIYENEQTTTRKKITTNSHAKNMWMIREHNKSANMLSYPINPPPFSHSIVYCSKEEKTTQEQTNTNMMHIQMFRCCETSLFSINILNTFIQAKVHATKPL